MAKGKRTKGQATQWPKEKEQKDRQHNGQRKKEQKDRLHNGQRKKNKRTNVSQNKRINAQAERTPKQPLMKPGVIDIIDTHREVLIQQNKSRLSF
jgi:ATP-dependent 26S proteasome regulatory subunit